MKRHTSPALAGALGACVALSAITMAPAQAAAEDYDVLVVGKTTGFRHSSIDEATTAIMALGESNGFTVDVWDPVVMNGDRVVSPGQPARTLATTPFTTADDLAKYETIVFVSTVDGTNNLNPATPTLLNASELEAFQGYIRAGGGYAGVHAATDSMHTIPWYSQLTGGGARFISHPAQQTAVQTVEDGTHPSTAHLGETWTRFDEWYNFTQSPRPVVRVLTNLEESSYNPGRYAMGADHPLAWCHNFEGARSWYTAGGHTEASFTDPAFLAHLLGGIAWSAGVVSGGGDCVTWYEVETLVSDLLDEGAISQKAATQITKLLAKAEALADAGESAEAAEKLNAVAAQVIAHVRDDAAARETLAGKVADLQAWQQAIG